MIIFDFFSGTGSATQAFKDAGHTVYSFELNGNFNATEHVNILELTAEYLLGKYGQPDFIWASPPCTAFSIASAKHQCETDISFLPILNVQVQLHHSVLGLQ